MPDAAKQPFDPTAFGFRDSGGEFTLHESYQGGRSLRFHLVPLGEEWSLTRYVSPRSRLPKARPGQIYFGRICCNRFAEVLFRNLADSPEEFLLFGQKTEPIGLSERAHITAADKCQIASYVLAHIKRTYTLDECTTKQVLSLAVRSIPIWGKTGDQSSQ